MSGAEQGPAKGCRQLIVILGDQLSPRISSLAGADRAQDRVLMVEVQAETVYVPHHKKKIAFILSAMRHFADSLRADGWQVDYVRLDAAGNSGSFRGEVARACARLTPERVCVTEPGEWRVLEDMTGWQDALGREVVIFEDSRFLASRADFEIFAAGRKQLRMEHFYRQMRVRTGLLMDGDQPAGGKWNYDTDNRKPAGADLFMPGPARFPPDQTTQEVLALVGTRFAAHMGQLEPFWFAVTKAQAEAAFDTFVETALARFGTYQDAMLQGEKFLYHSVVSAYLNIGLLDPLDLCRKVEAAYRAGAVPLNAAEGYIRQIIGWREFVRGLYWLSMPGYGSTNVLAAFRPLPGFYWTGETRMRCLSDAVGQTVEEAYAHHIQRLMVTGNFALLAGVDPHQLHEWYLSVYADAFEWVELPNTVGMSQFADGGRLASKPYMSSGNYLNKMSNYCRSCSYDVNTKTGEGACPFNALYWDFLDRHQMLLKGNRRLSRPYASWARMGAKRQRALKDSAAAFLSRLDRGQPV